MRIALFIFFESNNVYSFCGKFILQLKQIAALNKCLPKQISVKINVSKSKWPQKQMFAKNKCLLKQISAKKQMPANNWHCRNSKLLCKPNVIPLCNIKCYTTVQYQMLYNCAISNVILLCNIKDCFRDISSAEIHFNPNSI